jgi:UDP-glucose 4-epimerase
MRQVVEMTREVTGRPVQVIERERRAGDQPATVATSARIREALGWQPRYSDLRTLISTAWAWRQSHPNGYEK